MPYDVFISHASEDKRDIARPLADALIARGVNVWLDEFELTLGDSLRRTIDNGLRSSRFGVVVLSPHFLEKEWPQKELDALVSSEQGGEKRILPIWHNLGREDIASRSPLLADRLAVSTKDGIDYIVEEILKVIPASENKPRNESIEPKEPPHEPDPDAIDNKPLLGGMSCLVIFLVLLMALFAMLVSYPTWLSMMRKETPEQPEVVVCVLDLSYTEIDKGNGYVTYQGEVKMLLINRGQKPAAVTKVELGISGRDRKGRSGGMSVCTVDVMKVVPEGDGIEVTGSFKYGDGRNLVREADSYIPDPDHVYISAYWGEERPYWIHCIPLADNIEREGESTWSCNAWSCKLADPSGRGTIGDEICP